MNGGTVIVEASPPTIAAGPPPTTAPDGPEAPTDPGVSVADMRACFEALASGTASAPFAADAVLRVAIWTHELRCSEYHFGPPCHLDVARIASESDTNQILTNSGRMFS